MAVVALRSDNGVGAHWKAMANGDVVSMMSGRGMGGAGMGSMMGGTGRSSGAIAGAPRTTVVATSFTFAPKEIRVKAGEAVNIRLIATDVAHDLTIDELGFKVAAEPGRPGVGGLRAPSEPGRFTFYCSIAGHRAAGMVGTLVVDPAG